MRLHLHSVECGSRKGKMNKDLTRQIVNVVVFVVTIVVNGLATGLPLNGMDTGQISDMFEVYFVPAGYVFSIWGLIYLLLLGFTVYQALPSQRENPALRKIGYLFALNGIANSVWIFLWHYLQFPATLLAMFTVLGTLILIYLRLDIGRRQVSPRENWLVHMPFRVYLGWITVATIANIADVLYYVGWSGWGLSDETWMALILAAVVIIAGLMTWFRRDVAYLLVLIWALIGITVKQAGADFVVNVTWVTTGLVALQALYAILRPRPA